MALLTIFQKSKLKYKKALDVIITTTDFASKDIAIKKILYILLAYMAVIFVTYLISLSYYSAHPSPIATTNLTLLLVAYFAVAVIILGMMVWYISFKKSIKADEDRANVEKLQSLINQELDESTNNKKEG